MSDLGFDAEKERQFLLKYGDFDPNKVKEEEETIEQYFKRVFPDGNKLTGPNGEEFEITLMEKGRK